MTDTEKAALERRIDELCAEVERLHADQAHWELGNCPSCPNVVSLQEALEQNERLREENQSVGMAAYELGRASLADENADVNGYILPPYSEYERLYDENAKLSELVQYILDECYGDDWFGEKAEELGFKANY